VGATHSLGKKKKAKDMSCVKRWEIKSETTITIHG
jgi:hypothetical protein